MGRKERISRGVIPEAWIIRGKIIFMLHKMLEKSFVLLGARPAFLRGSYEFAEVAKVGEGFLSCFTWNM
jgi:hypothetical protein